jgi:lysophospholipase L1-like esterase
MRGGAWSGVTLVKRLLWFSLLAAIFGPIAGRADEPTRFEWKDGDRVVLIGDALIERDQSSGYLETMITLQNPDKTITFRNLGWSGDTPYGIARAGFGPQADGFRHLKEHVLALKPTVLVIGYGMTDSFDQAAGLPRFREGMNGLLDAVAETKARLVVLSPIAHEDVGRPLPDPAPHNEALKLYRDALGKLADERGARFVDLFEYFDLQSAAHHRHPADGHPHVTDDGIHLNEKGSWAFAQAVNLNLGDHPPRSVIFGPGCKLQESENSSVAKVDVTPRGLRFEMTGQYLPTPPLPLPLAEGGAGAGRAGLAPLRLRFDDLPEGRYVLSIDGRRVATAEAADWAKTFVSLSRGPEDEQVEQLRRTIIAKNLLYFYRWRPQNETYLFGFRKKEQGQNAREIPLFDPLVEEKEKEIARLRVPVSHVYELVRESEEPK